MGNPCPFLSPSGKLLTAFSAGQGLRITSKKEIIPGQAPHLRVLKCQKKSRDEVNFSLGDGVGAGE